MADSKITALTSISTSTDPANDPLVIVDVSDTSMAASGTTKKVTLNQLLGASGTATLASATITGDLTVDTSTLKVDSANNRVGIGTATLFGDLNIQNGTNCRFELGSAAGGTVIENLNNARNAYLDMTMYADAYIWNRLGSEVMRLNSTGLGVGLSPVSGEKLSVNGSVFINAGNALKLCNASGNYVSQILNTAGSGQGNFAFVLGASTPMTLDASGNLLVGKTAASLANAGFRVDPTGEVYTSVAANTNGTSTYAVYSTTDLGYKFYVGLAGTVFATNTTISAISDARLKENVQDIDVGLGAILALKPRKFDWKAGKGKDIKGDRGFIAQEFEQVFPQLVDEWKDAAPEGEAPYKSVRQDLIPVLVKAIQELAAEVNALKNA